MFKVMIGWCFLFVWTPVSYTVINGEQLRNANLNGNYWPGWMLYSENYQNIGPWISIWTKMNARDNEGLDLANVRGNNGLRLDLAWISLKSLKLISKPFSKRVISSWMSISISQIQCISVEIDRCSFSPIRVYNSFTFQPGNVSIVPFLRCLQYIYRYCHLSWKSVDIVRI